MVTIDREHLRERRRKCGMTLDDMALALGLRPDAVRPALSRFERGRGELPSGVTVELYELALMEFERRFRGGAK